MKTIRIRVPEPAYRDFQRLARMHGRTASELIREAMEDFRERHTAGSTTLAAVNPVSVGRILKPLSREGTLLEMLDDDRT